MHMTAGHYSSRKHISRFNDYKIPMLSTAVLILPMASKSPSPYGCGRGPHGPGWAFQGRIPRPARRMLYENESRPRQREISVRRPGKYGAQGGGDGRPCAPPQAPAATYVARRIEAQQSIMSQYIKGLTGYIACARHCRQLVYSPARIRIIRPPIIRRLTRWHYLEKKPQLLAALTPSRSRDIATRCCAPG